SGALDLAGRGHGEPELGVAPAGGRLLGLGLLVGERGGRDGDRLVSATAPHLQRQLLAGTDLGDSAGEVAGILDLTTVHREDHVAALQARLGRGAALLNVVDERSLSLLEAEAVGDLRRYRLHHDADPAAADGALLHELIG